MTNDNAKYWLSNLVNATEAVAQAVEEEAGYSTARECEALGEALKTLEEAVKQNTIKNIPW
jgi:uncharacterized protein with HEPN domain